MTFVIISGGIHSFACCMESTQVLTLVEKIGTATGGVGCYIEEEREIFLAIATILGCDRLNETQISS